MARASLGTSGPHPSSRSRAAYGHRGTLDDSSARHDVGFDRLVYCSVSSTGRCGGRQPARGRVAQVARGDPARPRAPRHRERRRPRLDLGRQPGRTALPRQDRRRRPDSARTAAARGPSTPARASQRRPTREVADRTPRSDPRTPIDCGLRVTNRGAGAPRSAASPRVRRRGHSTPFGSDGPSLGARHGAPEPLGVGRGVQPGRDSRPGVIERRLQTRYGSIGPSYGHACAPLERGEAPSTGPGGRT